MMELAELGCYEGDLWLLLEFVFAASEAVSRYVLLPFSKTEKH